MDFSPATLKHALSTGPADTHYWVAYSGGVDSHVLLHALTALRDSLAAAPGAVHVNHGLQAAAGKWQEHCRSVCRALAVPLVELQVDGRAVGGESPEAAARQARYSALQDWLPDGHCLLTAQHQDDQAETLLLQLLRGSGVKGLAAMPAASTFGAGHLLRPLLAVRRVDLLAYAQQHGLQWVEDPSNTDTGLDRNFLRHRILPVLRERWPATSETLARSAAHCAEAATLLGQLADSDINDVCHEQMACLSIPALQQLTPARQRNVLRSWLVQHSGGAPSAAVLSRISNDILGSRADAEPCVRFAAQEVRRYRDRLYLQRQAPVHNPAMVLDWDLRGPLLLPAAGGSLTASRESGNGIRLAAINRQVRVSYRRGGERCRPAGRQHHHSLKKLFQERGVPPWERQRIPLIYVDDRLAAVAGHWVCEPFSAAAGEPGMAIHWHRQPDQPN
ncbi:MAG: tRNA lysidine(34) synthetase TilS [Pseudomonadota bacterium]